MLELKLFDGKSLTSLVLGVFVTIGRLRSFIALLSILFLAACQDEPQPVVQVSFTPSPTAIFTPRPSSTTIPPSPTAVEVTGTAEPTYTRTPIPPTRIPPTSRPSPTPTLTPFPDILLTPVTPPAQTGYRLKPWTAEDADNLGRLMEFYYDRVSRYFDFTITQLFANSFAKYPALAYWEAQHRFPDSHLQTHWRFGEAFHRAISNDPTSPDLIRELLIEALNSGQTTPSLPDLTLWLNNYPSLMSVQLEEFPPPSGYTGSFVIAIGIERYAVGGTTIWILENEAGYTATTLHSNLGRPHSYRYRLETAALTNPETINSITITDYTRSGFSFGDYFIYDLNQPNPIRLDFGPQSSWIFSSFPELALEKDDDGRDHITIIAHETVFCPLDITARFEWNGRWFEQVLSETQFVGNSSPEDCFHYWLSKPSFYMISDIDRVDILANYETKFGDFQPTGEGWIYQEFTPDAQDLVRFTLAFNHAILGNVEQAGDYLHLIIENPSIPDSRWIEPAEAFLTQYQSPEHLYPACLNAAAEICSLRDAFSHSVANLPPVDWTTLRTQIIDWRAAVAAGGSFDFDSDGEIEHWLALRHQPNTTLELWLFGQWDQGWQAVYVDDVDLLPLNFQLETIDPAELSNPISFEHTIFSIGEDIYAFYRHPVHQKPYTRRLFYNRPTQEPYPQSDQILAVLQQLWEGTDPGIIVDDMLALTADPTFNPSAQYHYYLGLAYELSGDEDNAVAAYLRTWQDYCCDNWEDWQFENLYITANPYAIMAQAKLIP